MTSPTFTDILHAKQTLARYLSRTPLANYPALDKLCGTPILVKHENQQLTGAFKVRGGINLISHLSADERERGVITASTGNHGQSVAYAASLFGVRATVVAPEKSNPLKVAAMRDLGAEVLFHGADFDAAREHCEMLSKRKKLRYIHSANEPLLIAGVATIALEILEDAPEVMTIIVPVGGGSGAAGCCLVAKTLNPLIKVIGVQAERAPAAYESWRAHELLEDKMETAAEGLATRTAFELTQRILWNHLDDFVLVSEDEMFTAISLYVEKAHTLAEAAGAASLAAALKLREQLTGQTVAVVLSGGNITIEQLSSALAT
ncbi:MAG: threonine/serine dehydratase, partial [Acidobacteria bacterium]|nr:threonine/serine dehydratase [Acidobacteriota bacterium]